MQRFPLSSPPFLSLNEVLERYKRVALGIITTQLWLMLLLLLFFHLDIFVQTVYKLLRVIISLVLHNPIHPNKAPADHLAYIAEK